MPDPKNLFGLVHNIRAEAIGTPGQRRFRLIVEGNPGIAHLWLEKGQLMQLSVIIQQMLDDLPPETNILTNAETNMPTTPVDDNIIEFDIGDLSIGHDQENNLFMLQAHDREDEPGTPPALGFWVDQSQIADLAIEAQTVCAAGRPICPLCNDPINPDGHSCPRSNGHYPN